MRAVASTTPTLDSLDWPMHADQVRVFELHARPLVAIVQQRIVIDRLNQIIVAPAARNPGVS